MIVGVVLVCVFTGFPRCISGQGAAFSGLELRVFHTCVSSANHQQYKKPGLPFTWFHIASVTSSVKLSTEPLSEDQASGVLFYFCDSGACYWLVLSLRFNFSDSRVQGDSRMLCLLLVILSFHLVLCIVLLNCSSFQWYFAFLHLKRVFLPCCVAIFTLGKLFSSCQQVMET